jgi:hypothetical protein
MGRPRKFSGPGRILSTKIPAAYFNQFEHGAQRPGLTKSELLGYIVKTVVDRRGWIEELETLEKEKKERLIRYIMSTFGCSGFLVIACFFEPSP